MYKSFSAINFWSNEYLQGGFMIDIHFLTKNVKTKKFYQRQGGSIKDNSFGLDSKTSDLTVISPPSEDEDYPFSNTNEDPFGDFDTMDDDW